MWPNKYSMEVDNDSPRPLALPLLIQPMLLLAIVTARAHWWPMSLQDHQGCSLRAVPSPYQNRGGSFSGAGAQKHHQALIPPPPQGSPCSPCPWLMTLFQPSHHHQSLPH